MRFSEKIPDRDSIIFFKFDTDINPWHRAIHWTYDPFVKKGCFVIKGDCTTYPISEKTEYWEV